jgi:NTE family protein
LKVLEEAGVKIDYIGGTSMGAVIGGLTLLDIMQLKLILFFQSTNFSELTILFPDHLKILRKKK